MASSTNDQLTFNGPFSRAGLLLLPQYAASEVFLSAGNWIGTRNHILSLAGGGDEQNAEPLYCIVVGTIAAEKAYLGKHGNFSPKFTEDAQKAKIQFTITRPNDPDFGPDFDKAITAFETQQRVVSETPLHLYFLLKEGGNAMCMNFSLFEPKGNPYDQQRERETLLYTVDHQYEPYWTNAKTSNHICIMPAFDTVGAPINPNRFTEKLVGAMCEITFTLRHYAIGSNTRSDGRKVEANDVFSAKVEAVTVLKNPPVLVRSPYKGQGRRPQHRPQLLTRGEQVNSAAAFVPQPEFGRALAGPSTTVAPLKIQLDSIMTSPTSNIVPPISTAAITTLAPAAVPSPSAGSFPIHANAIPIKNSITEVATADPAIPIDGTGIKPKGSLALIATLASNDDREKAQTLAELPSSKKRKLGD